LNRAVVPKNFSFEGGCCINLDVVGSFFSVPRFSINTSLDVSDGVLNACIRGKDGSWPVSVSQCNVLESLEVPQDVFVDCISKSNWDPLLVAEGAVVVEEILDDVDNDGCRSSIVDFRSSLQDDFLVGNDISFLDIEELSHDGSIEVEEERSWSLRGERDGLGN